MEKMLKVITVTNSVLHTDRLIKSLTKHGWDWVLLECEWKGFGTKLVETYNYLKAHPEVDRFIFCDAFDVVAMAGPEEFENKMDYKDKIFCSAERGLWPPTIQPFRSEYQAWPHGFNYLNSGLYYAPSALFIKLYETYPPFYEIDDQIWMNMVYLLRGRKVDPIPIIKDSSQSIFNSHSFIHEGEYTYNSGRVQINGNEPIFIHSNGKTADEKLNELLR